MAFFERVMTIEELKSAYRRLVMMYHPDRGGDAEKMKALNYEYARRLRKLSAPLTSLNEVCVGHVVKVNNTESVVTEVYRDYFKARSRATGREAYFSKSTGFAMLNFRFRATL